MKSSTTTSRFMKTAACPASATLLSHASGNLPGDVAEGVREHLEVCDFCSAELPLLAHHTPASGVHGPPEMPMDLRILAESILAQLCRKK